MMKFNQLLIVLLSFIICFACGETSENTESRDSETATKMEEIAPTTTAEPIETEEEIEYKEGYYKGTIDNKYPIIAHLYINPDNESITGTYFYHNPGLGLNLYGKLNKSGVIEIKEKSDGKTTGTFAGQLSGNEIKGTWTKTGGKALPFVLTEYEPKNEGIEGKYVSGSDDDLLVISLPKNNVLFHATVVTENARCIGELLAVGKLKEDNQIAFSADGCSDLSLSFKDNTVVVEEKSCTDFHGATCTLDGTYSK